MVRRSRSTSARRRRRCGRAPYQPARVHALPSVCRLTHARRAAIPQKKPKDEEAEEGGAAEPASAAADDDDDDAVLDFSKKKKKKPARPRPPRALPPALSSALFVAPCALFVSLTEKGADLVDAALDAAAKARVAVLAAVLGEAQRLEHDLRVRLLGETL